MFQTPYGSATVGICMDINDPRFLTHLRRQRPQLLCFPTNWVDEGEDPRRYWAKQLTGWSGTLVAADRWGEEDGIGFCGRSVIMRNGENLVDVPAEGDGWWGVEAELKAKAPGVEAAAAVKP